MIRIELSGEEIVTLQAIAKLRYEYARGRGVVDEQVGGQTSDATDFIGMCAEYAFCKHFNIYPDIGVTTAKPYDCTMLGFTFDVKGTKYATGKLLLRKTENHIPCDMYALVTGEAPILTIRGFMLRDHFLVEERLGRLTEGAPLSYIADQSELRQFKTEAKQNG